MAFQHVLNTLSSNVHRDTFSNPLMETQIEPFRNSIQEFPYAIPQQAQNFSLLNGIQISGFGSKPHPHPVHKTLELNLLNNVWHHSEKKPSSVMFMKETKFQKLQKKNSNFTEVLNYHLTTKDSSRYSTSSNSLPSNDTVYMHDALMYFASFALFSLMSSSARNASLKLKSKVHLPSNPQVNSIQAELLSVSHQESIRPCQTVSPISTTSTNSHPTTQKNHPAPSLFKIRGGHNSKSFPSGQLPSRQIQLHSSPTQKQNYLLPDHPLPYHDLTTPHPSALKVTVPSVPPDQSAQPSPTSDSSSSTHLMDSALSTLLSLALNNLPSKSSSSTSSNDPMEKADELQQTAIPLSGSHGALVPAPAASAPAPKLSRTPSPGFARSDLIRPFQWNCYDLTGTESKSTSIPIATKDIIINMCRPYQKGRIVSLECVMMPTCNAIKYPVTVEIIWTPANAQIDESRMMNTYGAVRLTAGSLTDPSLHHTLPCNFDLMCDIVKDSVTYNNCPTLNIKFWQNPDSLAKKTEAPISASLIIRGRLELTAPAVCPTY